MAKLSETKVQTGNAERPSPATFVDLIEFKDTKAHTYRPVGDIAIQATHWMEITNKEGKKVRLGQTCRNIDIDGNEVDGKCAWCSINHKPRHGFFQNMIQVEAEENRPRKSAPPTPEEAKSGFKQKGSKAWTPVAVMQFPPSVASEMQTITDKNVDKKGVKRELSDPNFGRALDISKNTKLAAANMWSIQKADDMMRKLTDEQKGYLIFDLSLLIKVMPSAKESLRSMKELVIKIVDKEFEELDLEAYPELINERNKAKKKSKSGSFEVNNNENDDEDEAPRKKSKKRHVVEDDNNEDNNNSNSNDNDDEDERPAKKKVRAKKKSKKSYSLDDLR